jgi:hypothetical protein
LEISDLARIPLIGVIRERPNDTERVVKFVIIALKFFSGLRSNDHGIKALAMASLNAENASFGA